MASNEAGFDRENIYDSIDVERDGVLKSNEQILQNENSDLKKEARNALLLTWLIGFIGVLILTAGIPIGLAAASGGATIIAICSVVAAAAGVLTIFSAKDFADKQKIVDKTIVKQNETQQKLQNQVNKALLRKNKQTAEKSIEANLLEAQTIVNNATKISAVSQMQNQLEENLKKEQLSTSQRNLGLLVSNNAADIQVNGYQNTNKIEEAALGTSQKRSEAMKAVDSTLRVNNGGIEAKERLEIERLAVSLKSLGADISDAKTYLECDKYLNSFDENKITGILNIWKSITEKDPAFEMNTDLQSEHKVIIQGIVKAKILELETQLQQDKEQHSKLNIPFNNTQNIVNGIGGELKSVA
jgi:hypothetical protein